LKAEHGSPTTSSSGKQPLGEEEGPFTPSGVVRRPQCFTHTLWVSHEYVEIRRSTFKEIIHPKKFLNCMALTTSIIDSNPSIYQEVADWQVWRDAMMEEYTSIMKNVVWDIVSRLEGKLVVSSNWLYKFKHVLDGNIEKFKTRFVARGFS
jgi:hypothetical protein